MNEKKFIQDLNITFKKRGWKLLPEDNQIGWEGWFFVVDYDLYIMRNHIPYDLYLDKFQKEQLDEYVMEYLKPICKNHNVKTVFFYDFIDNEVNHMDGRRIRMFYD